MRHYKNIKAYKLADELVLETYKITKFFPKEETYGIVSQLRRAIVSVPTNIAEGASRQHKKDYLNFLYNSRASLAESEYLFGLAGRLGYLSKEHFESLQLKLTETIKVLFGLIQFVEKEVL